MNIPAKAGFEDRYDMAGNIFPIVGCSSIKVFPISSRVSVGEKGV